MILTIMTLQVLKLKGLLGQFLEEVFKGRFFQILETTTAQKAKFSIKDFLKKSLMENFHFLCSE